MPRKIRDYKDEYAKYHGQPEQIKQRSARNQARRAYEKAHGDLPSTVDVDHKRALSRGGTSALQNLQAVSRSTNRSFARTSTGALKSQRSRRESK
jgi:hypothetical protein